MAYLIADWYSPGLRLILIEGDAVARFATAGLVFSLLATPFGASGQSAEPGSLDPLAIVDGLEGEWIFEIFPAESAVPTRTGTRVFRRPTPGHPMLTWTESFEGSDVVLSGVIGYDRERNEFYELGSPAGGPIDFWIGRLSTNGRTIAWTDPRDEVSPDRGLLTFTGPDRFDFDNGTFRAVFVGIRASGHQP